MANFIRVSANLVFAVFILFIAIKILSKIFDAATIKYGTLSKKKQSGLLAVCGLLIILWPLLAKGSPYIIRTSIMALIYVVLALSLNMVIGFAGQLSMGHSAFFGIGAYVVALLTVSYSVSFWIAMLMAGIVAAIFGFILGIPTLRLKGDYLAITTIGFAEIVRLVLVNWTNVTRGPAGIPGIPSPRIFGLVLRSNVAYYYIILILAALTVFVSYRLLHSRLGLGLIAVKDDEIAADAMGVNSTNLKILAFVLGGAIAGVAGGFFASFIRYVNPDNFTYMESVLILCMVVLGGVGSIPGVIIGAVVLTVLPEALRDISTYRYAVYGLLLIVMMIIRPQGMVSKEILKGGKLNADNGGKGGNKVLRWFSSSKQG
ncbi:branched-chain amino acid ABC transporter permease [Alkaliphilus peptidifermentans]|uniref:Branched-chain amino acid transport system permease protein n=1 Tax=Alkaliphilus peptidifermentans DSM 18978 TaxID=1120976 RepID=A0A1G5L4S4_9FIRM|nr:branched-chain amino acid ABC transporter permease [Alkaliphilus peptidifermentans]SCZ07882.1 branched-chain amino acid transport system permease protein [Alkaliphilus peptidifermentans DSM 18978]